MTHIVKSLAFRISLLSTICLIVIATWLLSKPHLASGLVVRGDASPSGSDAKATGKAGTVHESLPAVRAETDNPWIKLQDGRALKAPELMNYKGMMFSDVPNLACTFGYTNASWTLKADLTSEYVCRLLAHMDRTGARRCTPRRTDPTLAEEPFVDFSSGYIQRALDQFPKQGSKRPWKLYQNYALDVVTLRYGKVDDGTMEFA